MSRYPIVLVHGIVASDRFTETLFWGRIPETLRRAGFAVFFGKTDSVGSVEGNSVALGKTVEAVVAATGEPKVLLMAHSKGGIDARHYAATQGETSRVAGLVTVCSPHGGSELADLLFSRMDPASRLSKSVSRIVGRLFPDRNPAPLLATSDLTTAAMERFNKRFPDRPDVLYQAFHTQMASPYDDLLLSQTYRTIRKISGPNDGIVSVRSATEGRESHEIKGARGGISHLQMLDLTRRRVSGQEIPDLWVEMANLALREIKANGTGALS